MTSVLAPQDGLVLVGTIRLEVRGTNIGNVELVPAGAIAPVVARFVVMPNRDLATLDLDTAQFPNGTMTASIVAYSAEAGQGGVMVEAMSARRWLLRNDPPPSARTGLPPVNLMPEVQIYPTQLPYRDPAPLNALAALSDAAFATELTTRPAEIRALLLTYLPPQVILLGGGIAGYTEIYGCINTLGSNPSAAITACRGTVLRLAGYIQAP